MSRRCWASLFTPCTAGGTRATAQSATGSSRAVPPGDRRGLAGATGREALGRPAAVPSACGFCTLTESSHSGLETIFEHLGCPGRPLPAAMQMSAVSDGFAYPSWSAVDRIALLRRSRSQPSCGNTRSLRPRNQVASHRRRPAMNAPREMTALRKRHHGPAWDPPKSDLKSGGKKGVE